MKSLALLATLAFPVLCDAPELCRCEERTLAEYFSGADEVVVAQLNTLRAVPGSQEVDLTFQVMAPPHLTPRPDAFSGNTIVYRTADNTAGCGVPRDMLATYVLFAHAPADATEGPWRIDTCTGSRVLLPMEGDTPGSFIDVPARFVPTRLDALAAMRVLQDVVAHAPDAGDPDNDELVGLLDVSGFTHAGLARLHDAPDVQAAVVAEVDGYDGLEVREAGYEEPTAVVFGVLDGWYKLRLADGRDGWLPPDFSGTYYPYPDVVVNRLNYIARPWHGFVWPSPGAGNPVRAPVVPGQREVPVEVHEVQLIGGYPWLRISVLRQSVCEGGDGSASVTGWIPAHGPSGEPAAWYYSRGC